MDFVHEHEQLVPRKRRSRACDQCRKRKVRCDGSEEQRSACSTCVALKDKCTYTPADELRKMRQVEEGYLQALESEVSMLRIRVKQLEAQLAEKEKPLSPSMRTATGRAHSVSRDSPTAPDALIKEEEADDSSFLEGFKFMNLNERQHLQFLGRSSNFPLIKAAIRMRHELAPEQDEPQPGARMDSMVFSRRRIQFWAHIFDYIPPEPPYTDFPDPAFMDSLFENYFRTIHVNFPVLHWPTFMQSVASGQHLTDEAFGAIVLLVCALGARFSQNPATLPPGASSWQLAGWQWFDQVRERRKLIPLRATTLHDVQVCMLASVYVANLGTPIAMYSLVGHGLRLAHDLGAHRRVTYGSKPSVEAELRKRAFWCLVTMDGGICAILGRPCNVHLEDVDVDFPIECDDEYWESDDPQKAFKQPHGKPSVVSHFSWHIRLMHIHAHALRTIYSPQGTKDLQDPELAQQIVADLDSELNQWADSLPPHLKYDPHREDVPFAAQAASLHASWLSLRIFIHRPFLTMPATVPVPFPSSTICTNAARSCIQALERYFALAGPVLVYQVHLGTLWVAATILLLHVWRGMRTGSGSDGAKELEYVRKVLNIFKSLELNWDAAGRFWDVTHDLLTAIESGLRKIASYTTGYPASPTGRQYQSTMYAGSQRRAPAPNTPVNLPLLAADAPDGRVGTLTLCSTPSWESSAPSPSPPPVDSNLEAMFADLFPAALQYHDPFAGLAQQGFSGAPIFYEEVDADAGIPQMYDAGYPSQWGAGPSFRSS